MATLQVRQHAPHPSGIALVNNSHLGQVATLGSVFVFEQVALKGFAAHDFAGASRSEALGCSTPGFEFRHEYIWFKTQLIMIPHQLPGYN